MNNHEKEQIEASQAKLRSTFGDEGRLYQYLFETLDNFYYRYIETTLNKGLRTIELGPGTWGAQSFENDMVSALKVQTKETKAVIMNLARTIPKSQDPRVRYTLKAIVKEMTPDRGHLVIEAEINGLEPFRKQVIFKYSEFAQFRKELALKLEEACEIFL